MNAPSPLRLAEWQSRAPDERWPDDVRDEFAALAQSWKDAHALNAPPFAWGGRDGQTLSARQWVGVVEVGDYRVEIYPKLDRHLLGEDTPQVSEGVADSTLKSLLRLIAAAEYEDWVGEERASLEFETLSFPDVWAFFLGRNLGRELRRGLPFAYTARADDLRQVRGRIQVARQIGHHFGRADVLACAWDEWSSDNALARLFRCVCEWLSARVGHSRSRLLLNECLWMLDDVTSVAPREALSATERWTFGRADARFAPAFDLARRLLGSQSPHFGARSRSNWTFLTDMNALFEAFCARALEDRLGVRVQEQFLIGHLFASPKQTKQLADFAWQSEGKWFVGDAKWKLLGGAAPVLQEDETEDVRPGSSSLSPSDVRQLTVYSELLKRDKGLSSAPEMWVLYPTLGEGNSRPAPLQTWNDGVLKRVPVRVCNWNSPGESLEL